MNRSGILLKQLRTYATKSKTTNLKWKPSVPVEQTTLSDGSVFITRQPVVEPSVQAKAGPLLSNRTAHKQLSQVEINEMRQLRDSNPTEWTRSKLAKKFGCSELFVSIAAPSQKEAAQQVLDHGYRRKLITEQRQKRRALW